MDISMHKLIHTLQFIATAQVICEDRDWPAAMHVMCLRDVARQSNQKYPVRVRLAGWESTEPMRGVGGVFMAL